MGYFVTFEVVDINRWKIQFIDLLTPNEKLDVQNVPRTFLTG